MIEATTATLHNAGVLETPKVVVADAGYWSSDNIDSRPADCPALFIAVARHVRRGKPRADGKPNTGRSLTLAATMTERLDTDEGRRLMRRGEPASSPSSARSNNASA